MTSYTYDPIHILNTSNTSSISGGGSFAVGGGASIGKNLYVGGNLNISGTTTSFADNIIVINQNPESSVDTGILLQRHTADITNNNNYSGIIYSETSDEFAFGYVESDPNKTSITLSNLIPIKAKSIILSSTENVSNNTIGGSMTLLGGASINKSLYVGDGVTTSNLYLTGSIYQNGLEFKSSSQWSDNGSNIYYTKGNIGIGTSSPSFNLDVSGTIKSDIYTGGSIQISGNLTSTNIIATNASTSNAVLTSVSGTNINFTNITGSSAQLTNVVSTNVSASNVVLTSASGINANFTNVTGSSAVLTSASGTNANFTNVTGSSAQLTNVVSTNITGSNAILTSASGTNANFTNVSASSAVLTSATGINANFTNVSASSAVLTSATGTNANFTNVSASSAVLTSATGTNANFTNVSASSAVLTSATGTNANFTNVSASSAQLTNITSTNVSASSAQLTNVTSTNVSASSAVLTSASGTNVNFTNVSASSAQLTNANFTNVSTSSAILTSASGTNANFTNITGSSARITNINANAISAGNLEISISIDAFGNSNTLGNIFTTGGNVGIGTTSPSLPFSVIASNVNSNLIYMKNSHTTGATVFQLENGHGTSAYFGISTSGNGVGLYRNRLFFQSPSDTVFTTNSSNSDARIFIQGTSGNVGIGTTAPTYTLDVNGTIDANAYTGGNMNLSGAISTANLVPTSSINFYANAANKQIALAQLPTNEYYGLGASNVAMQYQAGSNADHVFYTNSTIGSSNAALGTELMRIRGTGNIGIGTTNPGYKLDVRGAGYFSSGVSVAYGSATGINIAGLTNTKLIDISFANSQDQVNIYTPGNNSSTSKICIQHNGNVGINTTTPGEVLDVRGNLRVGNNSTNGNYIAFYGLNGDGPGSWDHCYIGERLYGAIDESELLLFKGNDQFSDRIRLLSGSIRFDTYTTAVNGSFNSVGTNGSTRMIITTGGSVGIGTVTPAYALDVVGSINASVNLVNGGFDFVLGNANQVDRGNSGQSRALVKDFSNALTINFANDFSGGTNIASKLYVSGTTILASSVTTGAMRINSTSSYNLSYSYLNSLGLVGMSSGTSEYSLYAGSKIAATEFNTYSDTRIKKDIQDIIDSTALDTIRLIQPKRYNYIDTLNKGDKPVWGFIAQQVDSVLDYAVNKVSEFVPNIYTMATIESCTEGTKLVLLEAKANILDITKAEGKIKIKMYIENESEPVKDVYVKTIIDDNTIIIEEELDSSIKRVFVYGQCVNDFHSLNKDAIFTVGIAALQEVDRQLQDTKYELQTTKNNLSNQQTIITNQQTIITNQQIVINNLNDEVITLKIQTQDIPQRLSNANL